MKKPEKCISVEEARKQQKEWINTRGREIERGKFKDTRDFWYSLDELQEYLDYVREKSREQGVKNPGIRFFLGAYPGAPNQSNSTIFLAPTLEKDPSALSTEEVKDPSEVSTEKDPSEVSTEKDSSEVSTEEVKNPNNYEIEPFNTIGTGWPPLNY